MTKKEIKEEVYAGLGFVLIMIIMFLFLIVS